MAAVPAVAVSHRQHRRRRSKLSEIETIVAHAYDKAWDDWRREKRAVDDMIRFALVDHSSPPHNYWQKEWLARQRLQTARMLLEAVKEPVP